MVLPDENIKTLDMLPRVQLIEDLQFRKQLPNSFKMFRYYQPFSEQACYMKNRINFTNQMAGDQLRSQKIREKQRFPPPKIPVLTLEEKAAKEIGMSEEQKIAAGPPLYAGKPGVKDITNSKSLSVPKSNINASMKKNIFGSDGVTIPLGTPQIHLLQFLDEKHLIEVNQKIIALYQKDITKQNIAYYKRGQEEKYTIEKSKSPEADAERGRPSLKHKSGKEKILEATDSSEEEVKKFDFLQDISSLVDIDPAQIQQNEDAENNPDPQPTHKRRRRKHNKKDRFDNLNQYETIITDAFKKSVASGNSAALQYFAQ